jgi:CubicO group peptidase (beta-lactamase class C family)
MRSRFSQACAVVLLLLCPAAAQAQTAAPDAETKAKVDAVFATYDKSDSPGCALGVIRDGRLIYARGYGMANLEHSIPITPQTVFDIGSTSKQFAASSILLLAQQGKLSLDDDVRKFVPALPAYGQPVTIRHLLHHTSGLRDYLSLMALAGIDFDSVTTDADALELITRQKALNFPPGAEHLYSNSGYFLLSVIVKSASGKSLREFAQEHIFGPLEMKHTHYHDDHTRIVPLRATGYAPRREGGFAVSMSGFEQTGDGAVYTTIEDLLLWDRNFYEPKVGGDELLRSLHTTGTLSSGSPLTYAAGLVVSDFRGLKTVRHGGSWAGYRAELLRFPDEKFSVSCLCNLGSANPSRLSQQVAEVFLGEKMAAPQQRAAAEAAQGVTLTEAELKPKASLYRGASGSLIRVAWRDGKLWIGPSGAPAEELLALSASRFRVRDWPPSSEVQFEPAGPRHRIRLLRENREPEMFEAVEEFTPTPEQLAEFGGTYYSEELDVNYVLAIENGRLSARVRGQSRLLQPTYRDAFTAGGRQFEFTRDAQGRVTGFAVQAGRVRNIRFVRTK